MKEQMNELLLQALETEMGGGGPRKNLRFRAMAKPSRQVDRFRYNAFMSHRIFLLSPADCCGRRAGYLLREDADLPLARRLGREGAPIGEVFSFLSGLYFRGKLAYATAFSAPPASLPGVLVITPNAGLVPPTRTIHLDTLRDFARGEIDLSNPAYRLPLERDARSISLAVGEDCEII